MSFATSVFCLEFQIVFMIWSLPVHTFLQKDSQISTHGLRVKMFFKGEFWVTKTFKAFYYKQILVTNLHQMFSTQSKARSVSNCETYTHAIQNLCSYRMCVHKHVYHWLIGQIVEHFWRPWAWPNTFFSFIVKHRIWKNKMENMRCDENGSSNP